MQRLKGVIRKVAAVGAGVAMLGATLTSAVALELADYPAPFVVDGAYDADTALVVGRSALASDTIGLANIAKKLQFESKVCVPGTVPGAVTVSGDSMEISSSGDLLELRESLADITQTVTELNLDGLAGGVVTTNEGTTEFNQYLRFSQRVSGGESLIAPVVNFTENQAPTSEVGDFLFVLEGTANASKSFFEYEIQFEDGFETDVVGKKLSDFEDEQLIILGNTYTVTSTTINTAERSVTLEMLGGSEYAIMEEGEVRTFTVDGKEYQVEVLIIEDTSPATVTFKVNGEVTSQLLDGETELLQDGTLLGVSDIILNEAGEAGLGDIVEVFVGAQKLRLKDDEFVNSETTSGVANLGFEQTVEVNDESIEDAWVQIKGTMADVNTTFEINSIKYRLVADALPGERDIYVPAGHGIREFLDEPDGMLGDWDIRYEGLDDVGVSTIKLNPRGDDEYSLEFENIRGQVYSFPFISNQGGTFKYGDDKNDFVFQEGTVNKSNPDSVTDHTFSVGRLDYFVLSDIGQASRLDDTATTHIVRYNSIDTSNKQIQFDELSSGTINFIYSNSDLNGTLGQADLVFGGNTYRAFIANLTTDTGDHPLAIDQDADGDQDNSTIAITVNGGGILMFENATNSAGASIVGGTGSTILSGTVGPATTITGNNVVVAVQTLSKDFDESKPSSVASGAVNEGTNFTIQKVGGTNIGINTTTTAINVGGAQGRGWVSNGGFTLVQPDDEDDYLYGMTDYGVLFTLFDPSGTTDPETLTIEYPLQQKGARVFITMGESTTTKSSAGEICNPTDIDVMTLFDDEVTDPTRYNIIAVGGPCINGVVEMIPGFPTCEGFRETYGAGDGVVQLVANGDMVAMLVAGYNAEDTLEAAKAVENGVGLEGDLVVV